MTEFKWDSKDGSNNLGLNKDNTKVTLDPSDSRSQFHTIFLKPNIRKKGEYELKFKLFGSLRGKRNEAALGVVNNQYATPFIGRRGIGDCQNSWSFYMAQYSQDVWHNMKSIQHITAEIKADKYLTMLIKNNGEKCDIVIHHEQLPSEVLFTVPFNSIKIGLTLYAGGDDAQPIGFELVNSNVSYVTQEEKQNVQEIPYQQMIAEKLSIYDAQINSLSSNSLSSIQQLLASNKQIISLQGAQQQVDDKLSICDIKIASLSSNVNELLKSNKEKDIRIQQLVAANEETNKQMKSMNDKLTQVLEEEKKDDDNNENVIMDEINKLKKEINKIKSNNSKNKPLSEEDKLRIFFESDVNLPEYTNLFLENGFEDMQSLYDLTMDDLKELNIKLGHRKKIFKCVQQKQQQNEQNILLQQSPQKHYEGSTAYI